VVKRQEREANCSHQTTAEAKKIYIYTATSSYVDRLCGLLVRLPVCRPRDPGIDSRRCQIFWVVVGLERGPLSPWEDKWGATWKKISDFYLENWDKWPWGIRCADHAKPLSPQKLVLNFANKSPSISRYSSLADQRPRSFVFLCFSICLHDVVLN
jgi:hypothetical protein